MAVLQFPPWDAERKQKLVLLAFGMKAEAALKPALLWFLAAHWRDMAADVSRVRAIERIKRRGSGWRQKVKLCSPRLGLALLYPY